MPFDVRRLGALVVSVGNEHGREAGVRCSFRLAIRRDQQRVFAEMSACPQDWHSRSVEGTLSRPPKFNKRYGVGRKAVKKAKVPCELPIDNLGKARRETYAGHPIACETARAEAQEVIA